MSTIRTFTRTIFYSHWICEDRELFGVVILDFYVVIAYENRPDERREEYIFILLRLFCFLTNFFVVLANLFFRQGAAFLEQFCFCQLILQCG